jgi:hypothetical protein
VTAKIGFVSDKCLRNITVASLARKGLVNGSNQQHRLRQKQWEPCFGKLSKTTSGLKEILKISEFFQILKTFSRQKTLKN